MPKKQKKAAAAPRPQSVSRPPLERMMRIHDAIQSGKYPNAGELAETLEVSRKSVQRDIEFMRERMNFPIEYDKNRWGYYYTKDVGSFPAFTVTEGELFAVLVAEKAMHQYRGTNLERPLMSAFKKLAASLPETISLHMADWEQTISFRSSAEPISNLEVFDKLARAAAEGRQLELQYRKPGSAAAENRAVDPYHMANVNGDWFLFAYCHLRKDIRTFVPARIVSAEPTGKRFQRPKDFSIESALRDSFGVHSGKGEHRVVIRFNEVVADLIREKKWHASQELKNLSNGGVELSLRLSSLVEVQRWILSWAGNAQVVAPDDLKRAVQEAGARLVSMT
jgi:predicted DNA-binding transcriptional regulator YafY